jgi:CBS domain-containing protein
MPTFKDRNVLTGMRVSQAMQRVVICLPADSSISLCVRQMIKSREDAVLVDNDQAMARGVVSKTDLMTAYYGGLPGETKIGDIMMGPVQTCSPEDPLDQVMDRMKQNNIHQIYVAAGEQGVVGKLEYGDIVGLVYRYCRQCKQSRRHPKDIERENLPRLRAKEVMRSRITSAKKGDTLYEIMDLLSQDKLKAVPILDEKGLPAGIISKTDLVLAYVHGIMPDAPAEKIMNSPVVSCGPDTLVADLILQMFVTDIGHLFVVDPKSGVAGVISLSDAARFRSGTCRACSLSRTI